MAEAVKAPTYNEYREIVKTRLAKKLPYVSEKELEKYLNDEETAEIIEEEYHRDKADYESGKLTYRQLTEGSPAGVAYGLDLMYEGPHDLYNSESN